MALVLVIHIVASIAFVVAPITKLASEKLFKQLVVVSGSCSLLSAAFLVFESGNWTQACIQGIMLAAVFYGIFYLTVLFESKAT